MRVQSKRTASDKLAEIARQYAECIRWLGNNPFPDAGPFDGVAERWLEAAKHDMIALAQKLGDPALLESIETAVDEGEFGEFDTDEVAFWNYISIWAEQIAS